MKSSNERPGGSLSGFAVVKDLTMHGSLAGTFERLGELLAPSGLTAALTVRLLADKEDTAEARQTIFTVAIAEGKAKVSTKGARKVDFELIMTPDAWREIASGKLPPHDAFFAGRMRARGNMQLAQDLLKHVAGSKGRTHFCKGLR